MHTRDMVEVTILLKWTKKLKWTIVQNYIDQHQHKIFIFTDGSKEPETGHTGAAFFIPHCEVAVKKRASDHLSAYTAELLGILLALKWVGENDQSNVIMASDRLSEIKSGKSSCRQDIVYEIFHELLRRLYRGLDISFLWVPAHVGVRVR